MINEINSVLELVASAIVFASLAWAYVIFKGKQKELKALQDKEAEKAISDEKAKIHAKVNSEPINDLLGSSSNVYSKIRSNKNN